LALSLALFAASARAQDNYEIQVYGSDTVEPRATMVELHSNFTFQGRKTVEDGVLPTDKALHETIEITHGFNDWFEVGFYIFTSARSGNGYQWVGDHIRPRVRAPAKWHWPVGVSLSTEFGYQRRRFSPDSWTLELRPIVDKKIGRWYLAFNPTIDRAIVGLSEKQGFGYSPNFKVSYDFSRRVSGGIEYYGVFGPFGNFDVFANQEQQILPAIDLNLSPKWELNFGLGIGTTRSTDHLLVKTIVGYRFDRLPWERRRQPR
jgi:hypothetical protein